ncbi:MAG TPA: beta-N-acetylhexosaminidase [Candidatus Lustribacter sp.]
MNTAALARSVIAVGFDGDRSADAPLEDLRAFAPGAVVLFGRNVGTAAALRALIRDLRGIETLPPLIAVDQEGGRVARIGEPVAQLPSAMAVGAARDVDACGRLGTLLGRDLARLGISVDFAPVADCAVEAENTVIGTRAYGSDPLAVGRFAGAFARGLEAGGVAAALKHFPGHGATAVDSHLALPRVRADEAAFRSRDLLPFAAAICGAAVQIVMVAHVVVDAFDARRPASLSPRILTGLLRDELGFEGVACTDCLQMDAIAREPGTVAGAVAALAAGADLLVVSHSLALARAAAEAITAAVEAGTLPRERLLEAAHRVRTLRERYATPHPYGGDLDPALPLALAQRAVTVLCGALRLREERPVTVISFEGDVFDGAAGVRAERPSLSTALRARRWKSEVMRVALDPDDDDVDLLLGHLPSLGDRNFVVTTRRAHLHPKQRAAVERILALVPDAAVVSAAEPFDALLWPRARTVACIYGDDPLAFAACADVLSGRATASGRLPVALGDRAVR